MEDNQFLLIYNAPEGLIFHLIENPLVIDDKWNYQSHTKSVTFTLGFEQINAAGKYFLPLKISDIIQLLKYKMDNYVLEGERVF